VCMGVPAPNCVTGNGGVESKELSVTVP
jgi:hypothetical protein